ncbi:MAG: hypothetical protein ACR2KX_13345 [Chitinophagaceae bacterium]
MKKLLFAVAIITISTASVNAQDNEMKSNGTTFSIAANIGTGTKTNYSTSYGADVQAEFPATTGLKITGSAGYQKFHVKVGNDLSVIPLLAGAKFALGKGLYGHPQLGYSFLTEKNPAPNSNNGEFSYAASIGYGFGKNLDLSLKYLSVDVVNAVLLRLAYNF